MSGNATYQELNLLSRRQGLRELIRIARDVAQFAYSICDDRADPLRTEGFLRVSRRGYACSRC